MKKLWAFMLTLLICVGMIMVFTPSIVHAAKQEGDIAGGVYDEVDWRITSEGELIFGNGTEQTFTYRDTRTSHMLPWTDVFSGGITYVDKIKSVRFDGIVHGNGSMGGMFSGCVNLTSIDFSGFDTSQVTDMSSMFSQCTGLTYIDLSTFDTSNVKQMTSMFSGCSGFTSLDVSNFDTSNVRSFYNMFAYCTGLTSIDVSNFDTRNAELLDEMFRGCSGLSSIDVSNFNTTNVWRMYGMFADCTKLKSMDLTNFDTSNVKEMQELFENCSSLEYVDLSSFDTNKVTNMVDYFWNCSKLKKINIGPNFKFKGNNITTQIYQCLFPTPVAFADGKGYTGKWISADGVYGPYMSEELRENYTSEMMGEWIWEERPFSTVVFNAENASGSMPNEGLFPDKDFKIPTCQYSIFDHTFLYWDDGHGHHYENKGVIPAGTYSDGITITLTAVFEKNSHNINMKDGAFEFSIKAGEKATFNDIPAGTSYQVYEKTEDGWVLVQQENTSGVIEALEESAASFWNKFQPGVVTVQFTGTKKLDGHPAKEGAYSFELLDETGNVLQTKSLIEGGFIQFDSIEYTKDDLGEHTYIIREIDPKDDSIDYDIHEEIVTVLVKEGGKTGIIHSDNLDDAGEQLSNYDWSDILGRGYVETADYITIPGAEKLHVKLKYSSYYGSVEAYKGIHRCLTASINEDYDGITDEEWDALDNSYVFTDYDYQGTTGNEYKVEEFDVEGDSLSLYYYSDVAEDLLNYGYYVEVTAGKLIADVTYDEDGVAFNNTTRPGILKITKDGSELTEANKDDTFTFEIEFTNENGMPISDNIYWYVEDQN